MTSLQQILAEAEKSNRALAHFNVSDLVALRAVTEAARSLSLPLLVGVSEGEREFIGTRQIAAWIRSIREEYGQPVFLNADHTHSLGKAEAAARAGFDMVLFDGSSLKFEENVRETKAAVEAVKSIHPSIVVEGEIGYIGASSKILDRVPKGAGQLTTPDEAKQFAEGTGIDVLSPAVGNMHGMLRSMLTDGVQKRLDIDRIRAIKQATRLWMTLHGGSGTKDADFKAAIQAGINIVHINTEIRIAWRSALQAALAKQPDEIAPYHLLTGPLEAIKEVALQRLRLFWPEEADSSRGPAAHL
jgi:fructose-bisphosphate aldolase class II